jgi:signal transduction histidine kinase
MDLHTAGSAGSGKARGAWMRLRWAGARVPAAALTVGGVVAGRPNAVVVGSIAALVVELMPRCAARREERAVLLAVAEERRRLARELHDGLAQDLAFIAMAGQRVAAGRGRHLLAPLGDAAARAIDETRAAIAGLDERADEALLAAVRRSTGELADRFGLQIIVQGDGAALSDAPRRDVLRLLREAVTNAARHGGARRITIELGGPGQLLSVCDDGTGMPAGLGARPGSRGVRGMHERAAKLGGTLTTQPRPQGGTTVLVRAA